jgi:hypothetical protein
MNAHTGSDREGLDECIERYGRDNRNVEGQPFIDNITGDLHGVL